MTELLVYKKNQLLTRRSHREHQRDNGCKLLTLLHPSRFRDSLLSQCFASEHLSCQF